MTGPSRVNSSTAALRHLGTVAVCVLLAATLFACSGGNGDSATDEQLTDLEANAQSLEESLEALAAENTELKGEIATLRGNLEDRDARIRELEEVASKMESTFTDKKQWSKDNDKQKSQPEGTVLERTVSLVEASGGEVHYVDHPKRGEPHGPGYAAEICRR